MPGNIEEFNKALGSNDLLKLKPGYPRYYYKYAKLLEKYDPKKAQTYLEIALKYWKNADDNFILKQRAVEFQKQLKTSS